MSADQYIEYVLLDHLLSAEFDEVACGRWMPADEFNKILNDAANVAIADRGYFSTNDYGDIVEKHRSVLIQKNAIKSEGDEFTGIYLRCNVNAKDDYLKLALMNNDIAKRINTLGEPALDRALKVIADREGWSLRDSLDEGGIAVDEQGGALVAPASDRVVLFSDNQINELEEQTTEIIDAISAQNQVADTPGMRELVLGQLKAGRELIRAGSFKAYVLSVTLIDALKFLAKRYESEAIGALAGALVAALVKIIGIDG